MGEAKWRKANDPTFGTIPKDGTRATINMDGFRAYSPSGGDAYSLMVLPKIGGNIESSMRGLVISTPITIVDRSISAKGGLDPQCLRSNLLFWDRLDWPTNSVIGFGLGADEEFLISAQVLQQSHVQFSGTGDGADIVLKSHLAAFKALDKAQPGSWSLSGDINSISFPATDLVQDRGVLVSLFGSLPVPNYDVPLAEILEFKLKRRDELLNLRIELEGLYAEVSSANDSDMALETAKLKLEKALVDHIRSSKEFPIAWRFTDLTAKLNFNKAAIGGAIGLLLGQKFEMPSLAPLIGAAIGAVQFELSGALKWRENVNTPYEYVTSYHKDLFGRLP